MTKQQMDNIEEEDEIDLLEVIAVLWQHVIGILLTGIIFGALFFGFLKCLGVIYDQLSITINGKEIYFLKELNLPMYFYNLIPYVAVLLVLAFTSKRSRAPKAEGIPYDKGMR